MNGMLDLVGSAVPVQGLAPEGQTLPGAMLPDFGEKVKQIGMVQKHWLRLEPVRPLLPIHGEWQAKGKHAALIDLALDPDVPAVLFHDALDQR